MGRRADIESGETRRHGNTEGGRETLCFRASSYSNNKICTFREISVSLRQSNYPRMSGYIFLDNLLFFAHHGVGEQETLSGNEFTINLRLKVDITRAMYTDDVADTVSYADVYEAVKAEMAKPSRLLEHVCGRITDRLFRDFPLIEEICLKLAKRNPPMGADIEAAGIELILQRSP